MSNHITPTVGRIVYYRGQDGQVRAAIITQVNGDFNLNLQVFPLDGMDTEAYLRESVTHADPDIEPGCLPSWHWMPYQKQQAEKAEKAESQLQTASVGYGSDPAYLRAQAIDMALRTGISHPKAVIDAAEAYYAHMVGEKAAPTRQPERGQVLAQAIEEGRQAAIASFGDAAIEQEIQAKGLIAPRVTPAAIEANIASETYFTAAEGKLGAYAVTTARANAGLADGDYELEQGPLRLLTFCVLTLRNGFTVTGESACASPENFDAAIGRKIALENAVQKLWPLMGYALKQQLHSQAVQA